MEQDDTPAENGWFYRRWFTFVSSSIYMAILTFSIIKIDDSSDLKWIALALIGAKVILDGLYMAGASVLDYAKVVASWKGNNKDE
jgi:hypothetical protein